MNEQNSSTCTNISHDTTCDSNNGGHNNLINSDLLAKLVAGITNPRDRALTLLMIDTGLRVGEVVQLDWDSIEIFSGDYSGTGNTQESKSAKGRRFYFTARTADALAAYWAERDGDGLSALFVSTKGTRLNSAAVNHIMHSWCDRLGIERFPLHHLRGHLATILIEGGCSLAALQSLLGHSSVETTMKLCSSRPYPRLDLMVN